MEKNIAETTNSIKATGISFTPDDLAQIHNLGITIDKVREHLRILENGIPKIILHKPAVLNNGIFPLSQKKAIDHAAFFDGKKEKFKLKKFVPASGAASRMFKFLCEFIAEFDPDKETINGYINRRKDNPLKVFLVALDKFPFYRDVMRVIKINHPEYTEWSKDEVYYHFIKTMLSAVYFDFANKPKGILPFHQYGDYIAAPVYEHLKESVAYAQSQNHANIHFTISEEHLDGFLNCIEETKTGIEQESGITINFSFSYQHRYTDTIAADKNNQPIRDENGKLVFRPAGHGALIENLNDLEADIVFIKNIDNVSHNHIGVIALYKKALAGILLELQQKTFACLEKIDRKDITENDIAEILAFAKEKLLLDFSADVSKYTIENKIAYLRQLLDRPIRVCGMVKNEREPGGGPFWVSGNKGNISLQIVESSQIDTDNPAQKEIFSASTHFNPVDLVCGLKNYKGDKFDLTRYVDTTTGFIVHKNKSGKNLKAYELPGLWNGAMADWITIFVEVPLETFNPVKTVNDLLKPAHQQQ